MKTVTVTGAAGNIAYSLLYRLAAGAVYGSEPVALRLLDLGSALPAVEGVVMELDDCAFDTLASVEITDDPNTAFAGAEAALLIGSKPRGPGMDRADLLAGNGTIFAGQARSIAENAKPEVKVVVTGNPANTNALIAQAHRGDLPETAITALTRLDHDRARSLLASHLGRPVAAIEGLAIWGNHSSTQYPDLTRATVDGRPVIDLVDPAWVSGTFIPAVAGRGAAIIKARGASSAASAANATLAHLRDWEYGTNGEIVSMSVVSHGEYGVPAGLVSSFPVTIDEEGYHVVEGLELDAESEKRIAASVAELAAERDTARELGFL